MSVATELALVLPVADNLLAARNLMAFTLGFHIILACVGVALPAMMLIAEYRGRKHGDEVALDLAKQWSKAAAVLFAVGAVTGTVLSFEMGLLWPKFMERFGDVFGTGFAIEGIFFFTEAIFIAIYIYGWKRLDGWAHFWSGVPIVIAGLGGAFSVVAVNAWMNQPQGFELAADGSVASVDPLAALLNPATLYEVPHMILAAYMVVGFGLASVYAIGMLRGRRGRRHRLGLIIPLSVAAICAPFQILVGDIAARSIADHQPSKFAAFKCITETGADKPLAIGGICTDDGIVGAIEIPALDSLLTGFSTDTVLTGLDSIPAEEQPPAKALLNLSFNVMVGIGMALLALGAWFGWTWRRKRDLPSSDWFLRAVAVSGVAAVVAMEAGWIVTEVGRQPWIVYKVMPTSEAVTDAGGLWFVFGGAVLLYAALGTISLLALRAIARGGSGSGQAPCSEVPYGPPSSSSQAPRAAGGHE